MLHSIAFLFGFLYSLSEIILCFLFVNYHLGLVLSLLVVSLYHFLLSVPIFFMFFKLYFKKSYFDIMPDRIQRYTMQSIPDKIAAILYLISIIELNLLFVFLYAIFPILSTTSAFIYFRKLKLYLLENDQYDEKTAA